MDWLTNFLKHIAVTKTVAFATLITSSILLFGHYFIPSQMEPMVGVWKTLAIISTAYSASILLVSLSNYFWRLLVKLYEVCLQAWFRRSISEDEIIMIEWIGHKGSDPVNLTIDFRNMSGLKKLEALQLTSSLQRKGLVESGRHDETIVWLTKRGRKLAIKHLSALEK